MNKTLIIVILAAVVVATIYFLKNDNQSSNQLIPERTGPSGGEVTVIYTESGYSPREVRAQSGTTVKFVNESNNPMWTASDPHPVHTMMHEFDALRAVMMGESYSFTFTEAGTWRYHNHLVPGHSGSVIVE